MDPYAVLGVPADAPADELRRRYRELVLRLHPDKAGAAADPAAFRKLQLAWATLSDPGRRREYDEKSTGAADAACG